MEQVAIVFWLFVGGVYGQGGVSALPVPYTSKATCEEAAQKLHSGHWRAVCIEMPPSDIEVFSAQLANPYNSGKYE